MVEYTKKMWKKIKQIGSIPYIFCILYGICLNMGVEMLSRKSLLSMLWYVWESPLIFFYNSLIISCTLSVVVLFRRRLFGFFFVGVVWLGLGLVNSILLVFRTTPFTAVDLLLVKYAWAVQGNYFTYGQRILLFCMIVIVFLGIVFIWWKAPKKEGILNRKKDVLYVIGMIVLLNLSTYGGTKSGILAENFGNIGQAFQTYGFPYGFGCSLFHTGIDKPKGYSPEQVDGLLNEVTEPIQHHPAETVTEKEKEEMPNMIYLQLESFFDPHYVKGVAYSEDPLPVFRKLKEEHSSGFLNVPSVGAGTANTEFEVITGMNLDFFGPGEYPYKTVLKEMTCESVAYNMKAFGYTASAIHNNEGTFYERNRVFSALGFDRFCSVEYMNIQEYTPMGWPKDKVLTREIQKALNSTSTKDMIYAISVQGHGSYPEEQPEEERNIQIDGLDIEGHHNGFEYYVNQIHEMDLFLKELLEMLQKYSEPVVLILYGDHLPSFGFTDESLINGDIYQTEYVIWANYPIEKIDKDLEAYQLSSHVMELLGIHEGILTRYHQIFEGDENYLENLKILEYDMLYGKQEVYEGVNPYEHTDIQMGLYPIILRKVVQKEEGIQIQGMNFTEYSKVFINGEEHHTQFFNTGRLFVPDSMLEEDDEVTVKQIGKDTQALSQTEIYGYHVEG